MRTTPTRLHPDALMGILVVLTATAAIALITTGTPGAITGFALLLGQLVAIWATPLRTPADDAICRHCAGWGWGDGHQCRPCTGTGLRARR